MPNLSPLDALILDLRFHRNSFILTICKEAQSFWPYNPKYETFIDPLVLLKHILNVLDAQRLPYSKGEVRKAFNAFWDRQCEDRKGYLLWIAKNALNRVTHRGKIRKSPLFDYQKAQTSAEPERMHTSAVTGA
jgi:hypothetical protein